MKVVVDYIVLVLYYYHTCERYVYILCRVTERHVSDVSGAQLIPLYPLHLLVLSVSAIHFIQKLSRIMMFSAFTS